MENTPREERGKENEKETSRVREIERGPGGFQVPITGAYRWTPPLPLRMHANVSRPTNAPTIHARVHTRNLRTVTSSFTIERRSWYVGAVADAYWECFDDGHTEGPKGD